ncbi:probable LRR receptor-like serine/threonine-protein kinase At4g31250 [Momordica charantia]|uniref:Probable LRR receptor-like serine/threonine-protein kinase At4g31250 n=1 Tax=Momordica charantia TaxID=3673 RepID=A0A6J1BQT0_MOMCH|nr:probable LRR receptor-like serine/threonine-protein kinase At4g31250 [Momordica charantia]
MAKSWPFIFSLLLNLLPSISAQPPPLPGDAQTLLRFRSSLTNVSALANWDPSAPICGGDRRFWAGLICKNGQLYGLRLETMGLGGAIDAVALASLPSLRTLSFMNNRLGGPLPDVKKIGALKALYLSNNNFSGTISGDAFEGMGSLRKVYLGQNRFSGKIPTSLAELKGLVELGLEENEFSGRIPDFEERDWKYLNLSDNQLEGPLPSAFKNSNFTSFLGNSGLCGEPLAPCNNRSSAKKWYILIGVFSGAAALILLLIIRRFLRSSKSSAAVFDDPKPKTKLFSPKNIFKKERSHSHPYSSTDSDENPKNGGPTGSALCFLRTDRPRFGFQELLGASAEVLGSGSFGSSYKALLANGSAVVVKRFRQMNAVGRDEFYGHMRRLGRISHPNLLPLVAFYYGKDDKLLVSDFVENGSLASHLHARRKLGDPGMDWPTRLKIIKGVARGLFHLHKELPHLSLPHGHLKSSNILLGQHFTPMLSDYALSPLLNKDHAHHHMAAYKSPEFARHDRASKTADVWSLGILILEVLTGKFPANYLRQGKGANADLAAWVDAVVREEWTAEVFDNDMIGVGVDDWDGEMLKLLKIGMCCCEWEVGKRWGLKEALERIEELSERGHNFEDEDDEYYSSYGSEKDLRSSSFHRRSDDESSFLN